MGAIMKLIKDNSREGNDCYIYEHWYYSDFFHLLMKITKYSCDDEVFNSIWQCSNEEVEKIMAEDI
jgi:hypothetical protein